MLAPAQTYCEKWQTCLDQIKSRTTEEEFVKWFKPIVPLEFDGKTLRLCVPNMSYVYQIEKHYIPFLRPIISQLYGQEIRLHYAVPKNDAQSVPVSKEADTTAISQFSTQTNTANIKKSVRHSGSQEDRHRPAAQPELHVRNLHRRGVQPPGPFGGYGRRGRSGPYAFQPAVYIR